MPRTYVALDLETTGLDPVSDAIIEVGAIRFDRNGAHQTFHTLVDPKRPIPYRIQRLTSICDADVAGAPPFAEVAGDLEAFIGDAAIVGQNVAFDLGFLERGLVRPVGPAFDTQDMASLLLPDLLEHSLRAIARHLDIAFPVQHRALADAEAACHVFLALQRRIASLPSALLAEAERIASATDWPLRHLLREALDELGGSRAGEAPELLHGAVRPPRDYGPPARPGGGAPLPIDAREMEALLTVNARRVLSDFEERPEQVAMARAVAGAFNHGEHLLVEAGTGTGKSLAYLVPGASYALRNNTRVVVSTNTINLQEQLLGQDIPLAHRLLDGGGLRAAQLKGRRNYLCLLRWANLRHSPRPTPEEARLLVRLLLWLPHTDTGDRAELRLSSGEDMVWNRLSAQNESCLATPCAFVKDGSCFLLRARRRAEAAHVLVVNHALLLSDIAVGGGVIPEYQHLVIDEAQHLEEEATDQFGFFAQEGDLSALLDKVASRTGGLAASVRNAARGPASQRSSVREVLDVAARAGDAAASARERLPDFFLRLAGFLRQQLGESGEYEDRLLLTRAMRVQPDWADVELAWDNLAAALGQVIGRLEELHTVLQSPEAEGLLEQESLLAEAAELLVTGGSLRRGIGAIVLTEDPNTICWLTQQRSADSVGLSSAPLRVSEILDQRLFSQKDTVLLTSATLTSEGRFDYIRSALGLAEANELALGSPFDYAQSTMVLVPQGMPEPNQAGYMASLQQALIELIRASQGRALALFTSHASLRAAYGGIKRTLEDEEVLVLGHNIDGSPKQLVQALRDHPRTAVLGTASFWEGVDVVGEALSLLVIARLPFSVPSDPIFQARSDLYDDAFNDYAVPQAVLRFKQGFGRLIRRKTDRGVMALLDSRVHTKAYGQAFLHSLPPCTVQQAPLRDMPGFVARWLGQET